MDVNLLGWSDVAFQLQLQLTFRVRRTARFRRQESRWESCMSGGIKSDEGAVEKWSKNGGEVGSRSRALARWGRSFSSGNNWAAVRRRNSPGRSRRTWVGVTLLTSPCIPVWRGARKKGRAQVPPRARARKSSVGQTQVRGPQPNRRRRTYILSPNLQLFFFFSFFSKCNIPISLLCRCWCFFASRVSWMSK